MQLKYPRTTKPQYLSPRLDTSSTTIRLVCTRPLTMETPGQKSSTACLPTRSHASCAKTRCGKNLLFAGTELGLFLSWNGGKDWSAFQLNLPITPITDLRVHKGNLIAATSGRSFWILDDLSALRQYKKDAPSFSIYRSDSAYLLNGSSELDRTEDEFTGANTFRGVNPATGVVFYYQLPELKKDDEITMEIKDAAGNVVRSFTSKADEKFIRYEAGPRPNPVLTKVKGLNR